MAQEQNGTEQGQNMADRNGENEQTEEVRRLQKKVQSLSEAYRQSCLELERLKNKAPNRKPKGRPGVDDAKKARAASLYRKNHSMRKVAEELGLGLGTVQKFLKEAELRSRVVYVFMDRERPATIIDSVAALEKVSCVNLTDDLISRAFGINEKPDWNDYTAFLESRCMPRTRYGIKEELRNLGIDFYDPFLIVEKTQGRVYEDGEWLWKLNQDQVRAYDEIMQKKSEKAELRGRLIEFLRELKGGEAE